jgi:hypothetical protein
MLYTDIMNQQMRIYKYAQSYIIILQHRVSVTLTTNVRASCHKNKISVQIVLQKCVI